MKIILETLKGSIEVKQIKTGLLVTKLNSKYPIQFELSGMHLSDIGEFISKDNLSRMIEEEMEYLINIEEQKHILIRKTNSWKHKLKNKIKSWKMKYI